MRTEITPGQTSDYLGFDLVTTQSFTPMDQVDALARIRRTVRQMGAADDAAASLRVQLVNVR